VVLGARRAVHNSRLGPQSARSKKNSGSHFIFTACKFERRAARMSLLWRKNIKPAALLLLISQPANTSSYFTTLSYSCHLRGSAAAAAAWTVVKFYNGQSSFVQGDPKRPSYKENWAWFYEIQHFLGREKHPSLAALDSLSLLCTVGRKVVNSGLDDLLEKNTFYSRWKITGLKHTQNTKEFKYLTLTFKVNVFEGILWGFAN